MLSIGDVSKISGVHIKSLRYYDEIGVLKPAYVDPDTHYRYYTYQQLGMLDAIRACIELDIPLKEFENFTGDNGNIISVGKLFEQGKKLANEKIRSIREGIKKIELFQREMERSEDMQSQTEPIIMDVREKQCYVAPIVDADDGTTYYDAFQTMMKEATRLGYTLGYELGKLYFYKSGYVLRYNFIEIIAPAKIKAENVITLPAAHCIAKCVNQSRIQYAEEEFPNLFSMDYDKIVAEIEIVMEDYNIEQPVYELSCTLPDDER